MGAVCAKPIATIKSWAKRKKQKNHITGGQQPRYGNEHDLIQPQQPYQSDNSLHKSSKFSKVPAVLGGLMAAKKHGSRGHGGGHQQQYDSRMVAKAVAKAAGVKAKVVVEVEIIKTLMMVDMMRGVTTMVENFKSFKEREDCSYHVHSLNNV